LRLCDRERRRLDDLLRPGPRDPRVDRVHRRPLLPSPGVADARTIGVAFTPAPTRRNIPEIAGTLWIDRASAELRSLEYHYVDLPDMPREALERVGGDIEFARMRGGGWVISAWDIRMPLLASEVNLG